MDNQNTKAEELQPKKENEASQLLEKDWIAQTEPVKNNDQDAGREHRTGNHHAAQSDE